MADLLTKYRHAAMALSQRHSSGTVTERRVLVLEPVSAGAWRAIEGEVGDGGITVLAAQALTGDAEGLARLRLLGNGADVVLVSNSQKSVCRFLDMVDAAPDQVRRMVALRLETELPYSVSESTWVCERRENRDGVSGHVLVIATATSEIAHAEEALRTQGLRCQGVEYNAASLAELLVTAPTTDECVGIVERDVGGATLAIAQRGVLCYARHIPIDHSASDARVASEVDQSVYDYQLRSQGARPTRVFVAGTDATGLIEPLQGRLGIPVEAAPCPQFLDVRAPAVVRDDLVAQFPACVGALIAVHRRLLGERAAAPPLRRRVRALETANLRSKRLVLAGTNAGLLLVLIAALFGVRAAQLSAAEHIIDESRPLLGGLERLQDEVDILQHERGRQRPILDTMRELAEVLPSEVKVETLTIDPKGKITVSGETRSVEAASDEAIAAMEASDLFIHPKFLGATKQKEAFGFRLTCELSQGPGRAKP